MLQLSDGLASEAGPFSCQSTNDRYQYDSLPGPKFFRVLELLPGLREGDDPIEIRVRIEELGHALPYGALSYVWGDPANPTDIICDGRPLSVTRNLRDALRRIRQGSITMLVWADAICIDQNNIEERGQQVQIMRQIYEGARKVIVWLGPDNNGEAQDAANLMRDIVQSTCSTAGISTEGLKSMEDFGPLMANIELSNLPPQDSPLWDTLVRFYNRAYFSRVWVIQEVCAACEVVALYGNIRISWEHITFTAAWLAVDNYGSDRDEILNRFRGGVRQAQWMHKGFDKCKTITEILGLSAAFSATDPRDHVYALLGFNAFRGQTEPMLPDYTKTKVQVYQEAVIRAINQSQDLQPLCFVRHGEALDGCVSSWIPTWDDGNHQQPVFGYVRRLASRGIQPSFALPTSLTVLPLQGITFDTITSIGKFEWGWWHNHAVWQWHEYGAKSMKYPTGEDLMTVHIAALSAGIDADWKNVAHDPQNHRRNFSAWLLHVVDGIKLPDPDHFNKERLHQDASSGNKESYAIAVERWCNTHRFFTTKEGYVGLGPPASRPGDIVAVLFGGSNPFILRQKIPHHQLIGACYLHGIADGQAVELYEKGLLRAQEFQLC